MSENLNQEVSEFKIFGMLENRESRGDRRVRIAGNTGLPRCKNKLV